MASILSINTHNSKAISTQISLSPPVTPIADESRKLPLYFTDDLQVCYINEKPVEFGRGAWSTVYKAQASLTAPTLAPGSLTPPSSPPGSAFVASRIFAVKVPSRRDARAVLQAEALTLTHLNLTLGHERYVVPFFGYHSESGALVMAAIPRALSTYIEDEADLTRKRQPSTSTMFDPILGPECWKDLARKLISCLSWLHHTAGMIHGDVKPYNILLRPIQATTDVSAGAFPFDPVLADFSSALDIPSEGMSQDTSRSAMLASTPPFTAPELLSLREELPTPASDIFSLAATLLAAATGDLLLYPGSSNMQRLAMARDGHQIIEFVRAGVNGVRVPQGGFVEKLLRPAICKDPAKRIDAKEWLLLAS